VEKESDEIMVAIPVERTTGAESVIWDLSIFYKGIDDPAIQRDMDALDARVDAFANTYRGRVAQIDTEEMVDALVELEAIYDQQGCIGSFASLTYATDSSNPQYGALVQKITEFGAQINQKIVFFELEWNNADENHAQKLLDDPTIGKYRHHLESERRFQPYQLSEIEEQLLVEKAVTGRNAWARFFTQYIGAMRLDFDGQKLTLSQVLPKLHDPDREVRSKGNDAITAALHENAMPLTYIFNVLVADKAADDKRRGYPTWVSSRNLSNKAPDAVVEALVNAVTAQYDLVARHYNLKRALLGYDELREYDRYAPLPVKKGDTFYNWDEAREIVLKAFSAFSPQVADVARRFFEESWIHAPVIPGKRGGAFSSGTVPSAHPFVLMNFTGKSDDVMTLAHELGHGVHQYLAGQKQGIFYQHTPLTTAEMASTFGEMLVFSDLMSKEADPEARLAMLAEKIEGTFATIFRQIAMNRFEDALHTARRSEGELTTDRISQFWMDTQKAMFQGSVNLRDDYGIWWAYVSHFVSVPGYVYAYSFGELLVLALFNLYQERGAAFVPQFIEVLASGDSDWPDKILAKAGIDLTDPNFWNEGLTILRNMVEQEEKLARGLYPDKF
jgi:oligoendopeptidase F